MWISIDTLQFLDTNNALIQWKDVLTIGRQYLYIDKNEYKKSGYTFPENKYSEKLWMELWVNSIKSVDGNDYEKPDFIHDMNYPITNDLESKFDIVFDGWTTEHIFNPAQALMNYHSMLCNGWYYIGVIPWNNMCNHWFYQFSPDLFYRFFSRDNWYDTMVFMNDWKKWGYVKDLQTLSNRNNSNINFSNSSTLLYIIAKKRDNKMFSFPIQTIFMEHLWNKTEKNISIEKNGLFLNIFKKIIPNYIQEKIVNHMILAELIKFVKTPLFIEKI